jgi:hypothetical protein
LHRLLVVVAVLVVTAACAPGMDSGQAANTPATSGPATGEPPSSIRAESQTAAAIPLCEELPSLRAPAHFYRDSPIYVGNEIPVERLQAWARTKPGFEELWIDRDNLGWVTLAFSADADARQAELEREFPGVGVVALQVDWTMAELEELQRRVARELMPGIASSSGIAVTKGVVSVGIGYLRPEKIAAVEQRFAGERVCLEGIDAALAPRPGPQPAAGDGWRLLADAKHVGQPYRTGLAFDEGSYAELWRQVGLAGDPPAVDFESEVVIWFGAVFGSSCPDIRLDDVAVDHERALVHAQVTDLNEPGPCTADANAHAYVVALERSKLPPGPFAIQLGADEPPPGAPEERTVVDVDLSQPGSIAGPGQVHGDPVLPGADVLEPGAIIEPGSSVLYRAWVHCGVEWLGPINGVHWRTEVPADRSDYVPPEWSDAVQDETIVLSITLRMTPDQSLSATANGFRVLYQPAAEQAPGCD